MNFLGIGPFELLLVMIIATIVLGPERMAEAGRVLGRYYAQYRNRWKKDVDEMTRELRRELAVLQQELDQVRQVTEGEFKAAQSLLEDAVNLETAPHTALPNAPEANTEPTSETPIPVKAATDTEEEQEASQVEAKTNEVEQ